MSFINLSISIVSAIIYICNIASVFLFAAIIVNKLYVSKKYSKSENFDLYNDLFSWETFFISIGIVNVIEIVLLFIRFNNSVFYYLFKIIILIMFSAFYMKIVHVEKIMRIITYERHYYAGIILFPIIVILLIFNIPILFLTIIFIIGSLIPFLIFFSFLKNKETLIKNSIKICIGAIFFTFGCILAAEYVNILITFDQSPSILYNIISISTPIFFLLGSFLIYWSIREYLRF